MEFTKKDIEKLNIILKSFEDYRKKIIDIDYIHNKVSFFEIMKEFRKHLVSLDQDMYKVFFHSKFFKFYKDFFTSTHEYYLRSLESMQALSVMTQGVHNFDSFSDIIDRDVLRENFERKNQELSPINFDGVETFVVVGSGPFPETLLYVCENTNVKNILGLDYNHEAIYMAGEMINGLAIDNISFKQFDGTKYDYKNADVVSIPLFIPLKTEVINRILETGKDNVQIMVTIPKGFLNLIYKGISDNVTRRGKITFRKDMVSTFVNQEIIKIEKYGF